MNKLPFFGLGPTMSKMRFYSKKNAMIHKLLGEVQQLKRQLDNFVAGNGDGDADATITPARLQGEIYRRLTFCQVLVSSSSFLFGSLKWKKMDLRSMLKRLVTSGCIDEQLYDDLLQIIISQGRLTYLFNSSQTFPSYSLLPPEIREKILLQVKSPVDRLNVIEALPGDGAFLKTDQLRLDFLEVVKSTNKLIENCKLTQDQYSQVVRSESFRLYGHPEALQTLEITESVSNSDWLSDCKAPQISVTITLAPSRNGLEAQLATLRRMKLCGISVLHCNICMANKLPDASSRLKKCQADAFKRVFGFVCQFLEQMPGLRFIKFLGASGDAQWELGNLEELAAQHRQAVKMKTVPALPELAFLYVLDLCSACPLAEFGEEKLLKKYGPVVKVLVVHPVDNQTRAQVRNVVAPNLIALQLHYNQFRGGVSHFQSSRFDLVTGSQLKFLDLDFGTRGHWKRGYPRKVNFAKLLCSLNCFEGTLESLKLYFHPDMQLYTPESPDWIGSLSLVKLRVFGIRGFPGSWSFLLQFPRLEKLHFSHRPKLGQVVDYFPQWDVPKFSWNLEEMLDSSVWEMFPQLELILMHYVRPTGSSDQSRYCGIRREVVEKVRRLAARTCVS